MSSLFIYPWDIASLGSKAISAALGARRILHNNSKFVGGREKTVINWGASVCPDEVMKCDLVNDPSEVKVSSDKIAFFKRMRDKGNARIPDWTTSKDTVYKWLSEGQLVVARTKTRSNGGKGIVFFDNLKSFVSAPLFTVYIKKKEEYRVHFAFGHVIDIQQKVLRKTDDAGNTIDPKSVDFRVRSFSNGFIFIKHNLHTPKDVIDQAMASAKASRLHFGAVDVLWNEQSQRAYVLEINTSPGIEGSTVDSYANAFKSNL